METWFYLTGTQNLQVDVLFRQRDLYGLIFTKAHILFADKSTCKKDHLTTNQWIHVIYGYDKTSSRLDLYDQDGLVCQKTGVVMKVRIFDIQGTSKQMQLLRLSR